MPSLQPFPIFGPKKKYHTQDQEKANWFSISDEITKINQGSWTMRCNETQGKNQNAIFSDKSPWNHLSIKLGFWFWYFAIRHSHLTITQEVSSTKLWAKTIILHFRCYCLDSWSKFWSHYWSRHEECRRSGVHFSLDVLPSWENWGSCADKCVC